MHQFGDDTKQAFLDHLARTGVVTASCAAAGIKSASCVYRWREEDPEFADAYREALETAADSLELEARRRAVEGVVKVKFYPKGHEHAGKGYDELEYSDSLLMQLLKAKKPNEYAERTKAEITSPDGSLTPENPTAAAVRIAALLDEARHRRSQAAIEEDDLFQ